jgi:hypothetical protein
MIPALDDAGKDLMINNRPGEISREENCKV